MPSENNYFLFVNSSKLYLFMVSVNMVTHITAPILLSIVFILK